MTMPIISEIVEKITKGFFILGQLRARKVSAQYAMNPRTKAIMPERDFVRRIAEKIAV